MSENPASVAPRVDDLVKKAYPVQLYQEDHAEEKYWVAEVPDLPGCLSDGTSPEEALNGLDEAKRLWLAAAIEQGLPVPSPSRQDEYSGRILLRVPRSLHRRLARQAMLEGTSTNQLLLMLLSQSLSARHDETPSAPVLASRVAEGRHSYSVGRGPQRKSRVAVGER